MYFPSTAVNLLHTHHMNNLEIQNTYFLASSDSARILFGFGSSKIQLGSNILWLRFCGFRFGCQL